MQINAIKVQINTSKLQTDVTKVQINTSKLLLNTTKVRVDVTQLQANATKVQEGTRKIFLNRREFDVQDFYLTPPLSRGETENLVVHRISYEG
ncbi:hypothetical protein VF14_04475 [Nostoc linckia z18]|uniref:Uncharacterized protein n=2 Tax=Nostoc linckia TaxID=92942 RepID=A0A9Q5Z9Y8_NOSLI|nr:hypothetical protein VF05_29240 [Nostoc linckia z3]PHJ64760.1 hypothetical protein VF02_12125 [Nostoc linckia z1]PHJ71000.1 hypothetical protein VF03_21080 [Nostoc linckia z2]PHJ82160.1 hypothetical protein VF07_28950 [Nostoc linckia z6]PHJ82808.1 hypothetical protein VF06_15135 [Nostoc linckia z4]PHJ99954.1 hypothetical protein VF04_04750 [Nostoc linckia z7]PHK01841.1 hypothetical protein VF08_20925 [Nostoc linckia z8]PHK12627.1 hypothetical protein VF09_03050 [Nostoc linckia z9]PHK1863